MAKKSTTPKGRTKRPRTSKLGTAPNLPAASSITGLSIQLLRAAKAAGCRGFRSNGTIACDALLEFVAKHPELLPDADQDVSYELERALRQRALRKLAELRLGEEDGRLMSKTDAAASVFRAFSAAKNALLGNRPTVASKIAAIVGGDMKVIDSILEDHHLEFLTELHAGKWDPKCPNCGKPPIEPG